MRFLSAIEVGSTGFSEMIHTASMNAPFSVSRILNPSEYHTSYHEAGQADQCLTHMSHSSLRSSHKVEETPNTMSLHDSRPSQNFLYSDSTRLQYPRLKHESSPPVNHHNTSSNALLDSHTTGKLTWLVYKVTRPSKPKQAKINRH